MPQPLKSKYDFSWGPITADDEEVDDLFHDGRKEQLQEGLLGTKELLTIYSKRKEKQDEVRRSQAKAQ